MFPLPHPTPLSRKWTIEFFYKSLFGNFLNSKKMHFSLVWCTEKRLKLFLKVQFVSGAPKTLRFLSVHIVQYVLIFLVFTAPKNWSVYLVFTTTKSFRFPVFHSTTLFSTLIFKHNLVSTPKKCNVSLVFHNDNNCVLWNQGNRNQICVVKTGK